MSFLVFTFAMTALKRRPKTSLKEKGKKEILFSEN